MGQDVIELLIDDHQEVTALVDQLLSTAEPEQRRELADTIIGQLVRHSVAEETIVYPIMATHLPDGEQAVEHDTGEHKQLEAVMKEMEGCPVGDDAFMSLVRRLRSVLEDHVRDEEDEQFPQLREHVPLDELEAMGGAVEVLKKVAPTRPHPEAPNNMLFHLTVGPGVGLVDRLRDALSTKTHV
jgi:hemerythrin superfamily protein